MAEIALRKPVDASGQRQLEKSTREALHALLDMAEILVQVSSTAEVGGESEYESSATYEVAMRLLELVRETLGCWRASILRMESETEALHLMAVASAAPEYEQQWQESERELLSDYLTDPQLLAHLSANKFLLLDAAMPLLGELDAAYGGIHRILVAPMFLADQFLGVLSIDYGNQDRVSTVEEQTLIRAVARLLILVIERDRLLQERAMARANELALREANRRMDEFLGMASHELRSPLTSIKAHIQIAERRIRLGLQEEENASEGLMDKLMVAQDLLRRADSQVGQLNRVVSDLVDISRIRSNRMELQLNPAPCDLISIVRDVVREQREVYPSRTILINLPPQDHIFVIMDANRIGQVVINYLTNAIKYSPADRPIEVSILQEREQVAVAVRDEGPGLPDSEHERIWERFYRVRDIKTLNNNGVGVGLGLGLHICKMIINLHHGKVGVQSAPGKGATFWFTLPLIRLE